MKQKQTQRKKRREVMKRLFVPAQAAGGVNRGTAPQAASVPSIPRPVMRLPIYYSDLMERTPSESEIDELASSFVRAPTFFMLAMLNTFISFYEHDRKNFTEVQGFLFANLADDELFKRAKQRFPHEQMGARPMFHRQQMLTLMKKMLLLAGDEGGHDPNDAGSKEGKYALGRAALMTNDLLVSEDQGRRLERREGAEDDDRRRRYEEFCTQMLPLYELSYPPEVMPALVRNDEYFKIFERMAAEGKFVFSGGDSVAARFYKVTGLGLKDYLLMILSVYLYYMGVSTEEGAVRRLMENPGKFNVGVGEIFSKMRFTADERRAFFRQTSTDVGGLIGACRVVRSKSPLMQQYDFTALRTYPLVYTREQADVVTCVDSSFLAEKISTGVYYNIKLPLEEEAKRLRADGEKEAAKVAQKDHDNFLAYWGGAFEIYVNDRLRDVRSPGLRRFYASPHYDEPPLKSDREVFDAVLDYGRALVVFEHKGKYLELGAKYSGDRDFLLADLKSENRIGKGVHQLADNIQWVFDNGPGAKRRTFHERNGGGKPTKRFDLGDIGRVKRIYPVIVHQDFSLSLNCVNQIMAGFFAEEMEKRRVNHGLAGPLSLLSVEDLEMVIPYLAALPLPDILEEYASDDDPLTTFDRIFSAFRRRKRTKPRRNEWMDRRSDEIRREIRDLFVDLSD